MNDGSVGNVGNNGNVKWNKQLADELDAADGKKDGKISGNIWNGFLDKMGSKGNHVTNFIDIENAEKSFNYYAETKDGGNVDWKNWQNMLFDFKKDLGLIVHNEPETSKISEAEQESELTQIEQQKQEFNEAISKSPLADVKTLEDFEKLDMSKYTLVEDRGPGTSMFVNPETNETILTKYDESSKNVTVTYSNGELSHTIEFKDGKFSEGKVETKQADGNVKTYDYSLADDGTKILGTKSPEEVQKKELQNVVDNSPLLQDKMPTEEELINAGYQKTGEEGTDLIYENPQTGETIQMTRGVGKGGRIYGLAECKYTKGDTRIIRLYNYTDGSVRYNGGYIYKKDNNGEFIYVADFNKNLKTGNYEVKTKSDEIKDAQEELQTTSSNSPLSKNTKPTEEELLAAGYVKQDLITKGEYEVYYNPSTGETIRIGKNDCKYEKDKVEIVKTYDSDGNVSGGSANMTISDGSTVTGEYQKNPETGEYELKLA